METTVRKATILVVEDDGATRALQQDLLNQAGYDVRVAASANAYLTKPFAPEALFGQLALLLGR